MICFRRIGLVDQLSDCEELVGHPIEHLGRNETNYFMYRWVGLSYKVIHGVFFLKHRFFYSLMSGEWLG